MYFLYGFIFPSEEEALTFSLISWYKYGPALLPSMNLPWAFWAYLCEISWIDPLFILIPYAIMLLISFRNSSHPRTGFCIFDLENLTMALSLICYLLYGCHDSRRRGHPITAALLYLLLSILKHLSFSS